MIFWGTSLQISVSESSFYAFYTEIKHFDGNQCAIKFLQFLRTNLNTIKKPQFFISIIFEIVNKRSGNDNY